MHKLLVILGPTATGKTDLGLQLAKTLNGELVSCDSRQVYKGLDIGTGKLPGKDVSFERYAGYWKIEDVPVWMYDVADPTSRFTVKEYLELAVPRISEITQRGKLPIIVGGTGLYLKGLLEGFDRLSIKDSPEYREKLESKELEDIQSIFQTELPTIWEGLNNSEQNNKRRLIRHLEIQSPTVNDNKNFQNGLASEYDVLKVGLTAPKNILDQRIDQRVDRRIQQGMISEGRQLMKDGLTIQRMEELGLEYRYLAYLLDGKMSEDEFIQTLKIRIHQYAKRQMTWFRREQNVHWFDCTDTNLIFEVEKLSVDWYNKP
jgi:tRNA dimethylallyltransferase